MQDMKIGFIGLGIMGSAMAANLLKAGLSVTVWNRSQDKCAPLQELGAVLAESPRLLAESSDLVVAMMATPQAVVAVRDGAEGIIAGLSSGKGFVDMSTVDAETSWESARLVHGKGALFLEAPVAGSRKPAEDGTLTIMTAGDRELYDASLPILEVMGKKILFLGDTGKAARMKLANNLVMCGALTALCEGLSLAENCGIDPAQLLEVLDSGAVANAMFRLKGPQISANKEFPVAFPLKHMQKDLRLALRLAEEVGQPLFATAIINELYKSAVAKGCGDEDFAAVSRVIRK
jgi:3-hydroxyisobutyrate dehydrogenase-like beta-hydroxyacid dehydrogenase